jgi:protoporphyrinogen oxidase
MSNTLNSRFGPFRSPDAGIVNKLRYSSSHIIGLGVRGRHRLEQKCWLYFPGEECNFYRATVFSNYSSFNVPSNEDNYVANLPTLVVTPAKNVQEEEEEKEEQASLSSEFPNECWSLMLEVSESDVKPVDVQSILADTIQGAVNANLLLPGDEIVSTYHRRLEYGYPTPSLHRDEALEVLLPALEDEYGILSRGRFGSWKYEVGNQDHSLALGVEAVDHLLFGSVEMTLRYPSLVNEKGKKNTALRYRS